VARLRFEHFQVMLTGEFGLVELAGIQVRQQEVRSNFPRILIQNFQQLVAGIPRVIGLLQGEREIVAGIDGAWLNGQGVLVIHQRFFPIGDSVGGQSLIVVGLKIGWIGLRRFLIGRQRKGRSAGLLGFDPFGEKSLRGPAVSGYGLRRRRP